MLMIKEQGRGRTIWPTTHTTPLHRFFYRTALVVLRSWTWCYRSFKTGSRGGVAHEAFEEVQQPRRDDVPQWIVDGITGIGPDARKANLRDERQGILCSSRRAETRGVQPPMGWLRRRAEGPVRMGMAKAGDGVDGASERTSEPHPS